MAGARFSIYAIYLGPEDLPCMTCPHAQGSTDISLLLAATTRFCNVFLPFEDGPFLLSFILAALLAALASIRARAAWRLRSFQLKTASQTVNNTLPVNGHPPIDNFLSQIGTKAEGTTNEAVGRAADLVRNGNRATMLIRMAHHSRGNSFLHIAHCAHNAPLVHWCCV